MHNLFNAQYLLPRDCPPGTLFWMRGWEPARLGIVLEPMPTATRTTVLWFTPYTQAWSAPTIDFIDEDTPILSLGSDWILEPIINLSQVPDAEARPAFISHLVVGNGGMFFESFTRDVGTGRRYIPVNGGAPAGNARPPQGLLRIEEFKIHLDRLSLERGAAPLLHVKA